MEEMGNSKNLRSKNLLMVKIVIEGRLFESQLSNRLSKNMCSSILSLLSEVELGLHLICRVRGILLLANPRTANTKKSKIVKVG